jgi:hypothetical protein
MVNNDNDFIYEEDIGFKYFEDPLDERFEAYDTNPDLMLLSETSYEERGKREILSLEVLDVDRYIKVNELKEVSNPTFFSTGGMPTSDGLLSNEIFGITQKDRAGTFAYIDLHEYFIDPSCYKTLTRLDNKFNFIVKGLKKYKIDGNGALIEDAGGGTGIKWLKANFDKIKFKKTESRSRDMRIKYIEHNFKKGVMFLNKWIVIPPYYRDANTGKKHTGVGQINTLYVNLITAANALRDNADYGLSMADTTCARIQDTLKAIYDWFCGNRNDSIKDPGTGLGGKFGLIRMNMAYTSDYSSRLVVSAPELKRETIDDLMVTLDKSAMPLAAVAADFYPFMLFHMRKFFENEFLNVINYEVVDSKGNLHMVDITDEMMYFTDDVIKDQLKKFVYSHDNRFLPIEIVARNGDPNIVYLMRFKGERWNDPERDVKENPEPIIRRPMTWVDVIYIAAVRSVEGKTAAITRFPYDSYFNTFYTGIEVASTTETEPIIIDGEYYRFYPKIRQEDILNNSASKFVDTMQVSNLYLKGSGMDYDGDSIQCKGSFMNETNDELRDFTNSKANFINMACENIRVSEKEAVQSLYNMTLVLSGDINKLTQPTF